MYTCFKIIIYWFIVIFKEAVIVIVHESAHFTRKYSPILGGPTLSIYL